MTSIIKCKFCEPVTDNFNILRSYLPGEHEYLVCSLNVTNGSFKTRLRTGGKHQDHAHRWLEEFQMQTKCTMRVERTYPHSGTKNVFKIDLRCQHNTRPRSDKVREKESRKNTDCPAKMGITIKRVVTERKSRSKDPHLPDHPTVIQMDFCHNHEILSPEILKHRSVLPEVREKLLGLFRLGHNPSTALDMHKYDLLLQHGDRFQDVCHDRALLPDAQFCYRLYYKIAKRQAFATSENQPAKRANNGDCCPLSDCENHSKAPEGEEESLAPPDKKGRKKRRLMESGLLETGEPMAERISSEMYKFCKSGGVAGMLKVDEENSVMALCTPLMLRVHSSLRQSGELVFVDAYGDAEESRGVASCRVHLLLTCSPAGALPLGCVAATSQECLGAALDLWTQILPQDRFFRKGDGPDVFFTGEDASEKQALRLCFPRSQVLTSTTHLLRASWSFLVERKGSIRREHRTLFFAKIKMLLFSQTPEELDLNYAYAVGDEIVKSNATVFDYINRIYEQRHSWSLVYSRHLLPPRTDSIFWESATVLLKDPILSRARTYNPLQVLDLVSRLDVHYERRLIDLSHQRLDALRLSRFSLLLLDPPREPYTLTQHSEIEYEVHNDTKDTTYQTDVSLGVCECRTGRTGAPCKHQLLVFRNFSVPLYDCAPPATHPERDALLRLATGHPPSTPTASEGEEDVDAPNKPSEDPPPPQQQRPLCVNVAQGEEMLLHDLDPGHAFFLEEDTPPVVPPPPQDSILKSILSPEEEEASGEGEETRRVVERICSELRARATPSLRPALDAFLVSLGRTRSEASLEHALYSFGRFSAASVPLFRRKVGPDNALVGLQSTGKRRAKLHPKSAL